MEPSNSSLQTQEDEPNEDSIITTNHQQLLPPFATITLSLPSLYLSKPIISQSQSHSLSPFISNLKIPSQISCLSLTTSTSPPPRNPSSKPVSRNTTLTPLHSPSPIPRRRPSDPSSSAAAGRRTSLLWFRSDLRVHDHEPLSAASEQSLSLLPVFLFDSRDRHTNSKPKSSSGLDRAGPNRAQFLIQAVSDLRDSLRSRGSDLVIRVGNPETVLVELAKAVGADAVYAHREVSSDEVKAEEKVEKALEEEGIEVKYFWGSTLYHIEDLPFELEKMPTNYGGFREKLKGVEVRKTIEALDQITGLPALGDVELGEVPTLMDLGQDGKPAVNASLKGGETEALERLKKFAAECHAQPKPESKDGAGDSIYGANFSCKISPWLATGCLSPRFMFEELKKAATRTISSASQKNDDPAVDTGMNWLMFELLWRDFFRFITKKCSSNTGKTAAVPAPALT